MGQRRRVNPLLDGPMARILRLLVAGEQSGMDGENELVNEGRVWMVGCEQVNGGACNRLIALGLLRSADWSDSSFRIYLLDPAGQRALEDPQYVPPMVAARITGARSVITRPDGSYDLE